MQDRPVDWHALHGVLPVHFKRRMLQGLHLTPSVSSIAKYGRYDWFFTLWRPFSSAPVALCVVVCSGVDAAFLIIGFNVDSHGKS